MHRVQPYLYAAPGGRAARALALASLCVLGSAQAQIDQPAILSTLDDGSLSIAYADAAIGLPTPAAVPILLPAGARPHGSAYITQDQALIADFRGPARLYRVSGGSGQLLSEIPVPGKSFGNGTIAVSPDGNSAIFAGEVVNGGVSSSQAVVLRAPFDGTGTQVALALPGLVKSFNTQSIAFAPDGRAFVCHSAGVSVLDPPYAGVAFTWANPEASGVACVMRRNGTRLAVTRRTAGPGIAFYDSPFNAATVPVFVPVPAGVGIITPLGVSPDGTALLVGQTFRPAGSSGPHARVLLLREIATPPFVSWEDVALPASITGEACVGNVTLCPGFEDMDVSRDGTLAIVTGNSTVVGGAGSSGRAPLVLIRNPFDTATRQVFAVTVGDVGALTHGRGTGSVRFLAPNLPLLRDGFE
jgi:hypothetical protein